MGKVPWTIRPEPAQLSTSHDYEMFDVTIPPEFVWVQWCAFYDAMEKKTLIGNLHLTFVTHTAFALIFHQLHKVNNSLPSVNLVLL